MGFLPSRPKIELFVPDPIFVGKPFTVEAEITAEDETRVEYVDISVVCSQGWRVSAGKTTISNVVKFPDYVARVMEAGTLAAATKQRFAASFTLPAGTAPTHANAPAWGEAAIYVRIGIPWWPDAKEHYLVDIRLQPPADLRRTPVIGRSRTTANDDARIELSLASSTLIAGEVLVGSVAVYNMSDDKERDVDLQIVPQLRLTGRGRDRLRTGRPLRATVTLAPGSSGSSTPFRIQLPPSMTPTFDTHTHEVTWLVSASTGSIFTGKTGIAMPIVIVDRAATATAPRLATPPVIGDERTAAVLTRFALRHGWRQVPATADNGEMAVVGDHADSQLELAYVYRKDAGGFLVSRLHTPSLGLGLAVVPGSTLRHLFFADIEVDIAAWDRAHRVTARSANQAVPFLKAVVPALANAGTLGPLVSWDDDTLIFEREVTDIDDKELAKARDQLMYLANQIGQAREHIPTPPGLGVDIGGWRKLAKQLDGLLGLGDLSIENATSNGLPVDLGLVFDENHDAKQFRIAVGSTEKASGGLRELRWSLARPAADVLAANVNAAVVDRLTRWPANVTDLLVQDGIATVTVGLGGPHDPQTIGDIVKSLAAMLAELSPDPGPYR